MSDLKDVKLLLTSMVSLIELLVDDTATLVDMVLVPRTSDEYVHEVQTRGIALISAGQELRLIANKVLDETDHSEGEVFRDLVGNLL
jgi:hypothetical protein